MRNQSGKNNNNYRTGLCCVGNVHPVYTMWLNMKSRCYNKNNKKYVNYGARGIKVCEEWLNNVKIFYEWVINNGWQKGYSIDRIDYDKDYCPENCRIISIAQNSRKKHTTKLTKEQADSIRKEYAENNASLKTLANKFGCSPGNIWFIVNKFTHVEDDECTKKLKEYYHK